MCFYFSALSEVSMYTNKFISLLYSVRSADHSSPLQWLERSDHPLVCDQMVAPRIRLVLHFGKLFCHSLWAKIHSSYNLFSEFRVCYCTEISSIFQFIKVKIIPEKIFVPVLFTPTRLEAKIWSHFSRYISATKKNPTTAC